MSTLTAERKQATIPNKVSKELVEQVIYIFQNHLAPMVESAIRDRVERYESPKPSTNTEALLTRNEFFTAMQLMEKRFDDVNKRFEDINRRFEEQNKYMEKRFEEQNKYMEKRFEDQNKYMEKRFEDVNKRFEDQKQYMDKRFNAVQWTIGIGFTILTSLMVAMWGF